MPKHTLQICANAVATIVVHSWHTNVSVGILATGYHNLS